MTCSLLSSITAVTVAVQDFMDKISSLGCSSKSLFELSFVS